MGPVTISDNPLFYRRLNSPKINFEIIIEDFVTETFKKRKYVLGRSFVTGPLGSIFGGGVTSEGTGGTDVIGGSKNWCGRTVLITKVS